MINAQGQIAHGNVSERRECKWTLVEKRERASVRTQAIARRCYPVRIWNTYAWHGCEQVSDMERNQAATLLSGSDMARIRTA